MLAQLPWLRSLNLRGCPVSERRDYPGAVLALLPDLDVLDDKRRADHPKAKEARAAKDAPADKAVNRTKFAFMPGARQHPPQAASARQPKALRHAQERVEGPPPGGPKPKGKANGAPTHPATAKSMTVEPGKTPGKRRAEPELPASGGGPKASTKKARVAAERGPGGAEAAAHGSAGEEHLGAERSLPLAGNPVQEGGRSDDRGQDLQAAPQPVSALVGIFEPQTEKRREKKKKKGQQSSVARGAQVSRFYQGCLQWSQINQGVF